MLRWMKLDIGKGFNKTFELAEVFFGSVIEFDCWMWLSNMKTACEWWIEDSWGLTRQWRGLWWFWFGFELLDVTRDIGLGLMLGKAFGILVSMRI
jgi:hypothetical protein